MIYLYANKDIVKDIVIRLFHFAELGQWISYALF